MEPDYKEIAKNSRLKVLDLLYQAQTSHIGSNLSCADIMAVLFEHMDLKEDVFVLSAGWKAAMLYFHLWRKGKITSVELNSYCVPGSKFIGLAEPVIPEIPISGGSMGLGLPGAIGIALAKKIKKESGKVYVLMSDGELQCGTTWESFLIASQHKLDNLVILCDYNKLQAMGSTEGILNLHNMQAKGEAFHLKTFVIDGHRHERIATCLQRRTPRTTHRPTLIICKTIKGKGVSFMEGNNLYHYKQLSKEEYEEAKQELYG
jgi:transketolase